MRKNLVLAFAVTIAVYCFVALLFSTQSNTQLQKELDRYKSHYIYQAGITVLGDKTINYQLVTLDGGQNWYVYSIGDNREVQIIGPVEEVYPGLIEHLTGLEALIGYVEEHGPIDIGRLSPEAQQILNEASITIESKEEK